MGMQLANWTNISASDCGLRCRLLQSLLDDDDAYDTDSDDDDDDDDDDDYDDDNDDDDNDHDLFDQFIIYYTAIARWSKVTRATSIPAQSQRVDL